jgi:hypothetical protein
MRIEEEDERMMMMNNAHGMDGIGARLGNTKEL